MRSSAISPQSATETVDTEPAVDDTPAEMRRRIVAALVIAASLVTPVAVGALWLRLALLNEHRYVRTVAPLATNRAIVSAVARRGHGHAARAGRREARSRTSSDGSGRSSAPASTATCSGTRREAAADLPVRAALAAATVQSHQALVAALEGKRERLIAA